MGYHGSTSEIKSEIEKSIKYYVLSIKYTKYQIQNTKYFSMQIHELKPKHKSRNRKIVGRGGKKGTYSGRGGKGQTARAGRKMVPIIRELIKRYPKLKGYRGLTLEDNSVVVNVGILEKHFKDTEIVNPENLIAKGIIRATKGKAPAVKILGTGKITKKIIVERCRLSVTAKAAIEKAGGSVKSM